MRRALALTLPLLGAAVACTSLIGDFTLLEPPVDAEARDSGSEPDSTTPDAPPATVHAVVATPQPVYVGQAVTFDASNSTTTQGSLAFSWEVSTVPPGSALTTLSLSSASSATPSVVPDVPGDFVLTVTVSAAGSSDSQQVTVTAFAPQVMFAGGTIGDGGADASASLDYFVVSLRPDGGAVQPLICSDAAIPAATARLGAYASRAFDVWEAPAGVPSRFAAFTMEAASDGGSYAHLWAGTFDASCPPVDFGTTDFGPDAPFGSEPRFSPDGTRFVVFDSNWDIVTYPFDGNGDTHVVAAYGLPYADAGPELDSVDEPADSGYILEPPRVSWTQAGTLAWARPIDETKWELVTAVDSPDAEVITQMTCDGTTPREIAFLADGTIVASYRDSLGGGENIWLLKTAANQLCKHDDEFAASSDTTQSVATDFAVSPDGTRLAFLWKDPPAGDGAAWPQGLPGGFIYVMLMSNPASAVQVSAEPALYGPRWIGGGAALAFTRLDGVAVSTGDVATSVVVMSPDGSAEQVVAQGDGVTSFVSTSGNAACALGPGIGGRLPWVTPVVLIAVARRFRRRAV
jgi:hypothetical protein